MMHSKRHRRSPNGMYSLCLLSTLLVLAVITTPAAAAIFNGEVIVADVTTRAASVVWISDEPVTDATVRVFGDANGTTEITTHLTVTLVSSLFPPALTRGIVKVQVTGLAADTSVFVQTKTVGSSGTALFPAAPPFIQIHTAVKTTKAKANNAPIVNDLIMHDVFVPAGGPSAAGTLMVLEVPNFGASPLTAFVAEGSFPPPTAVVDLNNLFATATGESTEVPAGKLLRVTEWRGLRCPLNTHKLVRFRRTPAHTETPPITELESAVPCFFADTVCDDTINILDAQRVLNLFNTLPQDCAFNPDIDVVLDHVINILDVQSVLNRFGEGAPFTP